jgi:MOSC domain-containing protein YiiM
MTTSEIFSIVYKPANSPASPKDHYSRIPLETAELVVGHGIEGDTKGSNPKRQLNVMSFEALQQLGSEGFSVAPGQMGEQIIIKGLNLNDLAEGECLQIGDEAVIEVISYRTGCDRFEALQSKPREDAKGRLGVMAGVVTSGTIRIGDKVKVLENV